jgi:hypothetical protein
MICDAVIKHASEPKFAPPSELHAETHAAVLSHSLCRRCHRARVISVALPKSPMSFAWGDEVPQISTRKPCLRPSEFLTPSAKRLLQLSAKTSREQMQQILLRRINRIVARILAELRRQLQPILQRSTLSSQVGDVNPISGPVVDAIGGIRDHSHLEMANLLSAVE